MNKQKLLDKLAKLASCLEDFKGITGYCDGKYAAYEIAIELAKQLDEPKSEPVEVPSCMGEFLDNYRDKDETAMSHIMIEFTESENFSDFLEFPLSDYPMGWDRLMASALLYGYTVKQTLWVIKDLDDEYISDVCLHQPDKVYNSSNRERSEILIFTDRAKAEAVATLVDGTVEEV